MPNGTGEIQTSQIKFGRLALHVVMDRFDGGGVTGDAEVLLLAATYRKSGLVGQAVRCVADPRNPLLITHCLGETQRQRVCGLNLRLGRPRRSSRTEAGSGPIQTPPAAVG
jgi:hypothetical protein